MLVWAGCDGNGSSTDPDPQTVGEIIESTPSFSQSADGFAQTGLDGELSDPDAGPFTAFVPDDAAFAAINASVLFSSGNAALLTEVMEYHILEERFPPDGAEQTTVIASREGTDLRLTRTQDGVFVNGIPVELVAETDNGLAYRLDTVQLRVLTIAQQLDVRPELSQLKARVDGAGLRATLDQPGPYTLFAPDNAAFSTFTDAAEPNASPYEELLLYHVLDDDLLNAELSDGQTLATQEADGGTVRITRSGETVSVNGVPIQESDVIAENGVIHTIGTPLTSGLSLAEVITLRSDLSMTGTVLGASSSSSVTALADENADITFFAPSDAAYDSLDVPTLESDASLRDEIAAYHILDDGSYSSADLSSGPPVRTTAEGEAIHIDVSGPSIQINRASVTGADVRGANGFLHVLDGVLLETTRGTERVQLTSRYQLLETALERVGLTATLSSGTYTIFAPPNEAFLDALDADDSGTIEEDEFPSDAQLEDILLYHVVPGTLPSGNIDDGDTATTLEGSSLTFDVAATGTITINSNADAGVVAPRDLDAENGVVHEVSVLLMP